MKTIVCGFEGCPDYRNPQKPMRMIKELVEGWGFECVTCCNPRIITKAVMGGTVGSGFDGIARNRVGYTAEKG